MSKARSYGIKNVIQKRRRDSRGVPMLPVMFAAQKSISIIHYLGLARLSCSGNINSVQTKTIPTTIPMIRILDFHSRIRICL
jgi:hypothetical protein